LTPNKEVTVSMHRLLIVLFLGVATSGVTQAQTSASEKRAARLTAGLDAKKLQYFAAADPAEAGRYVAAMRAGEAMLIVVSARYDVPSLLNERLWRNDHAGAYAELNAASVRAGKLFVQDLGAPGLQVQRLADQPFDIVYESGVTRTMFDGDWKGQGLSRDEYLTAHRRADEQYAHALEALLKALESQAVSSTARP
jgi:hypothetical protein